MKQKKMTQATFRAYKKDHVLHKRVAKKLKVTKSEVVRSGINYLAVIHNVV